METFYIQEKFGKNLALRENAREVMVDAKENSISTIDFSGIEFVSRSFANELAMQEKKSGLKLRKINMQDHVKIMFDNALNENSESSGGFRKGNVDEILSML